MARELVEELTYRGLEIMSRDQAKTTTNSNTDNNGDLTNTDLNFDELFSRIKRKLSQPFINMEQYVTSRQTSSRHNKSRGLRDKHKRHSVHGDVTGLHSFTDLQNDPVANGDCQFERIELSHFNVFTDNKASPTSGDRKHIKLGGGHHFLLESITNPAFCDYCRDPIWGMTKKCLRCANCRYTCHHRCRQLVTLDCEGENRLPEEPPVPPSYHYTPITKIPPASKMSPARKMPPSSEVPTNSGVSPISEVPPHIGLPPSEIPNNIIVAPTSEVPNNVGVPANSEVPSTSVNVSLTVKRLSDKAQDAVDCSIVSDEMRTSNGTSVQSRVETSANPNSPLMSSSQCSADGHSIDADTVSDNVYSTSTAHTSSLHSTLTKHTSKLTTTTSNDVTINRVDDVKVSSSCEVATPVSDVTSSSSCEAPSITVTDPSAHLSSNVTSPSRSMTSPSRSSVVNMTSPSLPSPLPSAHSVAYPYNTAPLRQRLDFYNRTQRTNITSLNMTDDNTFQGFIRVTLNLYRPINMLVVSRPPSIYDLISDTNKTSDSPPVCAQETMSFYVPKHTIKCLHISSMTTTSEVISELLHKFSITDSPRKFALYEHIRDIHTNKVKVRKVENSEFPLQLFLTWEEIEVGRGRGRGSFVLQENETGDILWDAFSLPELNNFLRILQREESERIDQIRTKYGLLKIQLNVKMRDAFKMENSTNQNSALGTSTMENSIEEDVSSALSMENSSSVEDDSSMETDDSTMRVKNSTIKFRYTPVRRENTSVTMDNVTLSDSEA